jgi:fatty acid/phospholipid biosynthesis enzyme
MTLCGKKPRLCARAILAHNFHAFPERHNIAAITTDVLVTDGFIRDVALPSG